jgi:hypothetical protein
MLLHSKKVQLARSVSLECTTFWVVTIVLNIYATGESWRITSKVDSGTDID